MRVHPNGHVPIALIDDGVRLPWNVRRCACGGLCDRRAKGCRKCTRVADQKWCSGCQRTKAMTAFYKLKDRVGYHTRCRECSNAYQRKRNANGKRPPRNYKAVAARIAIRCQTDPIFETAYRLRRIIRQAMSRTSVKKTATTIALLGCSIADFRIHIERQWKPGMAWENIGRTRDCWQLDHIRPVASFDLTKKEDQMSCFHFTNYQPLWALENAAKGAKWDGVIPKEH